MAIGRSRYAPPYMSTKGHSVLKQRSYSSPRSAPITTGYSRTSAYDRGEERSLSDRVSNVNFLSNTLMDEGYDTAVKSRGRDQQLLKEATNAIVSAESYATPQSSVASRRVARGQSVATRAASVPPRSLRPEVGSYYTRYSSSNRRTDEDDDDDEKPNSLLSWKYRLDSIVNPKDVIYEPSSLIRLKQRLKNAQAKMSEHREMLDKYLPEGDPEAADVASSIRRKMAAMDRRNPRVERRAREVEEENLVEEEEEEPLRASSEE